MGALFAKEENPTYFFFQVNDKGRKFETAEDVVEEFTDLINDSGKVSEIILSGNSYSLEACQKISEIVGTCHSL
jgi:Ran GTPase-activating protein 1